MARRVKRAQTQAGHREAVAVVDPAGGLTVLEDLVPQNRIGGVEQNRRVAEFGLCVEDVPNVVIMAVCQQDRADFAFADRFCNRIRVVCRVDDDDGGIVADNPHVVVDVKGFAVE